jgi:hypothetical protein
MAATAKDCSIMITLRRLPITDAQPSAGALGTLTVNSQQFEYKVILCTSPATRAILPCCELPQRTCSPPECCAFTVTSCQVLHTCGVCCSLRLQTWI